MDAFPAYIPLAGRRVIVAGAGDAAEAKARLFSGSPAEVVRIAGAAALSPQAYAGAVLAFVADADDAFAEAAAAAARAAHVPVNVADRPALCDFMTPAVIDRGEVVAAVGTGGAAPLLASLLRADIEARVPEGAGRLAALLRRMQDEVRAAFPDQAARRAFLRAAIAGPAAEAALAGDLEGAEALLRQALAGGAAPLGRVRFVAGAGPAERLTLAAARLLSEADVAIVDEDADRQVAALVRRDARRLEPQAATAEVVGDLARRGLLAVRVHVGPCDAELQALQALGVNAERV